MNRFSLFVLTEWFTLVAALSLNSGLAFRCVTTVAASLTGRPVKPLRRLISADAARITHLANP